MNYFTLKFFAKLRDDLGISEIRVPCSKVSQLSSLTDYLIEKNPNWAPYLAEPLLTAINHEMVNNDHRIEPEDEVALFPPVTGG